MTDSQTESSGYFSQIFQELTESPLNIALVAVCVILLYKIIFGNRRGDEPNVPAQPELTRLKKRDFTLEQLRQYADGNDPDGRILIAVNGKVFDVTKGKRFYGPGGPYAAFAGRDASRGLATFNVEGATEEHDDLSDLNTMQMDSVKEWEMQFTERYYFVGKLLKPGEEPTEYSDEDDTTSSTKSESEQEKSKND